MKFNTKIQFSTDFFLDRVLFYRYSSDYLENHELCIIGLKRGNTA